MTELWAAPVAASAVDATVPLPGSKSMTNRALVLAALGSGTATIHRPLDARDTALMAGGLVAMGAEVERTAADWTVTPGRLLGPSTVDVGNAGTVMRFLPVVAALADGPVHFDGDRRSRERPLAPLVAGLRALGAQIEDGGRGCLPFTVLGGGALPGGDATVDASQSSQFVSALLLAAPLFDKGLRLRHEGPPVPSAPHIRMTVQMLRATGVDVDDSEDATWTVQPGEPTATQWIVEPDLSNAAAFLAAAVVTGGRVRIPGWPAETTQAGAALPALFTRMGAAVTSEPEGLVLSGCDRVDGIDVDLHEVGELTPVVAAVCALAGTPSRLRGIAHLRQHETDRLAALCTELIRLGGKVRETADGLAIEPARLHGGVFHTYDDHRLATAGAVLGLVVDGVQVENVATTAKTLPDFPALWTRMLAGDRP